MVFIYVLQLENNKYYVGKTVNPAFRLNAHFNSHGSSWTQKYKPIKVLELVSNCSDFDEDKYTLKYMNEKGVMNVRGGSFCEFQLNDNDLQTIEKMIKGSTDKCFSCGESGHFANQCKLKNNKDNKDNKVQAIPENKILNCKHCNEVFETGKKARFHESKCKLLTKQQQRKQRKQRKQQRRQQRKQQKENQKENQKIETILTTIISTEQTSNEVIKTSYEIDSESEFEYDSDSDSDHKIKVSEPEAESETSVSESNSINKLIINMSKYVVYSLWNTLIGNNNNDDNDNDNDNDNNHHQSN